MACGAFGLIGCVYLLATLHPRRFRELVPWLGLLALAEGLILLVHGIRLGLGPWPFYGDVSACLVAGVGIVLSWVRARGELYEKTVEQARCSDPGDDASVRKRDPVAPAH